MKILIVAAHPDDELLGVGGTILKHKKAGDEVFICIVTKSYPPQWSVEYARKKKEEAKVIDGIIGTSKRFYCGFPTVKLNTISSGEINKKISDIVSEVNPDVIYTHYEHDIHRDHQIVFEAVMTATRPLERKIEVFCFETPSSTGWNNKTFNPNYFIEISEFIDKKIELFAKYESEVKAPPHPRSEEGIRVLARKRGIEICEEYAEAFLLVRGYWI